MQNIKIIGITGGSGSGKSTVVKKIREVFKDAVIIAQDNYYKSASYVNNSNITAFNFDHPDAFDTDLMLEHLEMLKNGMSIEMPQYDFVTHSRTDTTKHVKPSDVMILDGLMVLYDKRIRDLLDLKVYVDTPDDIRFIRRLKRDLTERGRTVDSVIKQYVDVVRPGFINFIEPTKEFADIIIPEGGYNEKALKVIISFLKDAGI